MKFALLMGIALSIAASAVPAQASQALAHDMSLVTDLSAARAALGKAVARKGNVNINRNVSTRKVRTKSVNINRPGNRPGNRHPHVTIDRDININRTVVRPVRPWIRRPYFGTVVAGITLGTIIAVSAAPVPPSPDLCWFWTNSSQTQGYWDYCAPPMQ